MREALNPPYNVLADYFSAEKQHQETRCYSYTQEYHRTSIGILDLTHTRRVTAPRMVCRLSKTQTTPS